MANSTAAQPNIIFIITDQQRYDTIAALGFPHVDTPNIDRLVREGVSFDRCYITAPACVPSRASLFTGYYPHTNGVYKNGDEWSRSWVESLSSAGYRCVNVGKMHTVPLDTPLGFQERYVVENKDRFLEARYYFDEWDKALAARGLEKQRRELYRKRSDYAERLGAFLWELPEDTHSDNFVGNSATWWLDKSPRREPLFLEVGFPGPHPPYDPVPRWAERYENRPIPPEFLDDIDDDDIAGQPEAMRVLREHHERIDHDSVVHHQKPDPQARLRQRRYYLANVSMIDEQVGHIMASLERNGYLDNSVIIFTSDHGDCLGDHGHIQKWNMYEQTVRVPAIVWCGKDVKLPRSSATTATTATTATPAVDAASDFVAPVRGARVEALCQLFDFGPTILELAGIAPPESMEARSLLPLLAAPQSTAAFRDYVYAEHGRDTIFEGSEVMTMVRDRRYKLVCFSDADDGQLFDLEQDPTEKRNLWNSPEAAAEKSRLLEQLRLWMIQSSYRSREFKRPSRVLPTERRTIADFL